jgi:hypothetical protein
MAYAYFYNAAPTSIAVNLNNNLETNHVLKTFTVDSLDDTNHTTLVYNAWAAGISAFPASDVFGGNDAANTLVVFRESSTTPEIYTVTSTISTTLDLYFCITGQTIIGSDATGSTAGITVTESAAESFALIQMLPEPMF